ncbi:MAG: PilZ domain-containing protein [Bryobacteraceae bacterium]
MAIELDAMSNGEHYAVSSSGEINREEWGPKVNRRRSVRVPVKLPARIDWPPGIAHIRMSTENISRTGMLLRWATAAGKVPRIGEMLIITAELPTLAGFDPRCIRCQATVARTSPAPGEPFTWVGVEVHAMDFQSLHAAEY